jgi:hypothetical protein
MRWNRNVNDRSEKAGAGLSTAPATALRWIRAHNDPGGSSGPPGIEPRTFE